MQLSLGFLVLLVLILFPGLIFRRLYYYGEFSKQFNTNNNLIRLLAVSSVPGLINLIFVFIFYDLFFTEIDLGKIVDLFKDLNSPNFRLSNSKETPIKELLNSKAAPFIGFIYINVVLLGSLSGRIIRTTKIDTKVKLLRFKNYWFYLFNGQNANFKKFRHLKKRNKTHLFTKADILIDANHSTYLYSGIVVDYELMEKDCTTLSKVMLQNAERYSTRDGKRVPVKIPGNLLVVECSSMKNINLTYIYQESINLLESKIPVSVEKVFGLIHLSLIPIFLFQADSIDWIIYNRYFDFTWYEKIIAYLLTIQVLGLFNPFNKKGNEYSWASYNYIFAKLVWIFILFSILRFLV